MKKVLVTGGLGFVGSHLVDALLTENADITVVDNLSSNAVGPEEYRGKCTVELADLEDYEPDTRFDEIYHLADIAGPAGVLKYPGSLGTRAMLGAERVLMIAEQAQARLLVVSSSEVYGRPGEFSETDSLCVYAPYTVRLEYAVAKILVEVAAMNRFRASGLRVNIVRPYNIAGPRQRSLGGFVIPRFFEAALSCSRMEVFGSGEQVRCFGHVADTVASLLTVQRCGQWGQIFNSGNRQNRITINELAHRVRALCKSSSEMVHVDPRTVYGGLYAEAFDKVPDTAKLEAMTGWHPRRSMDEILRDVYRHFTQRLPAALSQPIT